MTPFDPVDPHSAPPVPEAAAPIVPLEPLRAFTSVADRYEVDRVIAPCARGFLYAARDRTEGRAVTLEVVPNALASDAAGVAKFVEQAMAAAGLPSESIARPLAVGADAQLGVLWLAFEPFEGESLRSRIGRGGLSPRESVAIVTRVLDALAPAHDAGKAHRGLEPDDVVLTRNVDGTEGVRLLDFGFPRALAASADSPYVSPEQARESGWVTPAADTYSVGAIFYELISGHPPPSVSRPSLAEVSPQTPGGIVLLVERALSIDPGLRPAGARAMRDEIQRLLAPPKPAPAPAPPAAGAYAAQYGAPPLTRPAAAPAPAYAAPAPYASPPLQQNPSGGSVWPWVIGLLALVGMCFLAPVALVVFAAVMAANESRPAPYADPYIPPSDDVYGGDSDPQDVQPTSDQAPPTVQRYQVPIDADDPQRGPRDALVTIVEFSDFQCPFCGRATATMSELERTYAGDLRIVWRDQPLPFHSDAEPAALLAREAYAQQGDGGFWRMHDTLFANQRALSRGDLLRYAREQSLDVAGVRGALDSRAQLPKLQASSALGNRLGASGTPTFFINGRILTGAQPTAAFAAIIDEELRFARAMTLAGTPRADVYAQLTAGGLTAEPPAAPNPNEVAAPDPDANTVYTVAERSGAPSQGPASAPVVIQLFSDFQCPFCKRLTPTLEQLIADNPGKIRLVWRNYPLSFHTNAQLAAEAAMEAQAQGGDAKFWRMHAMLFDNQQALERADLERYAARLDLDLPRFRRALDAHVHASVIDQDTLAANATGLSIGTPTCFVNGRAVQGAQPLPVFQAAVERALAER
jgi:protein-disulfide isomerase